MLVGGLPAVDVGPLARVVAAVQGEDPHAVRPAGGEAVVVESGRRPGGRAGVAARLTQPTAQRVVSVKVELGRLAGGGGLSPKCLDQSQKPVPSRTARTGARSDCAPGTGLHVTNGSPRGRGGAEVDAAVIAHRVSRTVGVTSSNSFLKTGPSFHTPGLPSGSTARTRQW